MIGCDLVDATIQRARPLSMKKLSPRPSARDLIAVFGVMLGGAALAELVTIALGFGG